AGHVRHRQDAGGIFRGFGGAALRCRSSGGADDPGVLFLLLSPVLLLGAEPRPAGAAGELRYPAHLVPRPAERRGGGVVVSFSGQAADAALATSIGRSRRRGLSKPRLP